MSDLRGAKYRMNAAIAAEIDSREVFDPASLDCASRPELLPPVIMLVDDALSLEDDGVTVVGGGLSPRAPWEIGS